MSHKQNTVVLSLFCLTLGGLALAADAAPKPKPEAPAAAPAPSAAVEAGKDLYPIAAPQMTETCGQPLPNIYSSAATTVTEIHGVHLPRVISSERAVLPESARKSGFTGTAQVLAVICKDGTVGFASPMRATSPDIGGAAADAVLKWKFQPAKKGGEPVAVKYAVKVEFAPGS